MKSFIAKIGIQHNGDFYKPGDVLGLEKKDAASLLSVNAIEPTEQEAPVSESAATFPTDPNHEFTDEEIAAAIRMLREQAGDAPATVQSDSPDPDAIIAAIREVIPNLQPGDFTKNGDKSPKVKAVEAKLSGRYTADDITAELVADAWAHFQADKASKGQEPQHG